jgi:hypothetical protein
MNEGCRPALFEAAFDCSALTPLLRSSLRHLEPSLYNSYQRHYFVSRDARFRLTLDSQLRFSSVPHARGPASCAFRPASALVVELKYAPEFAEQAVFIANALPFRMTRFSKYIVGIEAT